MDYKDVLTKKEAEIWEDYNGKFLALKKRLDKPPPKIDKTEFSKSGIDKKLDLLSGSMRTDYKTLLEFIRTANNGYKALKSAMDEKKTTHEFITRKALDLLEINSARIWRELKPACTEPDRDTDLWRLTYEGHFFGKVKANQYGNFLKRVFDEWSLWLLDRIDDIDETALSNFSRYYEQACDDGIKLRELGWSAHYIQDLTAPHHVGNMAIGFEILTDDIATHFIFEKYARKYVYDHPQDFTARSAALFKELKPLFSPGHSNRFAKEVFKRAVPNVPDIMTTREAAWKRAIQKAIPLAIAATAVILERLK